MWVKKNNAGGISTSKNLVNRLWKRTRTGYAGLWTSEDFPEYNYKAVLKVLGLCGLE